MQGNRNYKPDTNHVSRVYGVAAVLYLHFVLYVTLFRMLIFFLLLNYYFSNYYCHHYHHHHHRRRVVFMRGIYNYITETYRVSIVYSVSAVLYTQFVLHVLLFRT